VLFVVIAAAAGVRAAALYAPFMAGIAWNSPGWLVSPPVSGRYQHAHESIQPPADNDALSLLVCAVGFLVIVAYAVRPRGWLLVAMVLIPAAGFLVKQSLESGACCSERGSWCSIGPSDFGVPSPSALAAWRYSGHVRRRPPALER
jgi:hypothetical protein